MQSMSEYTNFFSSLRRFTIPESRFSTVFPDSCSSGCLMKTNFIDEDTNKHIYLKLSHRAKNKVWGKESIFEVVCSRLGKQLGLPVLSYYPCLVDLQNGEPCSFGCYSYDYSSGEFVENAQELCNRCFGLYSTSLKHLQELGFEEQLNQIMVFDYLVGNTDRHMRNIEFRRADEEIQMVPIFDNGKSLLETFAAYPFAWDQDQMTNNFLTNGHTLRTFECVTKPVNLYTVESLKWSDVFSQLEDYLTVEEQQMIVDFVSHQYNVLMQKGLITND